MNKRQRAAHVKTLGRDIFKRKIKVWVQRNGKYVEVVPTLQEAIQAADDMQTLLDIANGDATPDQMKRMFRDKTDDLVH
jgi:hypothetical protein